MARRSAAADAVPERLLAYRERDWSSPQAWTAARAAWLDVHRPKSLADLNAFYGPAVVLAPRPDPREDVNAAA